MLTNLFFALLISKTLAKIYLNFRNIGHVTKNRHSIPSAFTNKITLEEHQKAADYTVAKNQLSQIDLLLGLAMMLIWFPTGLLENFHQFALTFSSPLLSGLILFALIGLVEFIVELPLSLYSTFVLEEKFGFNRMTVKLYIQDLIKQTLLGILIGVPVLSAILWFMQKFTDGWWLYAWAFLSIFQLILIWAYPRFIAPLFNKFSELPDGEKKEAIKILLHRTGFTAKGLFVMDASKRSGHGNAYFTGLGKNKRIVFFDTLLNQLEAEELEAVLAHELGHFKYNHIIKGMILSLIGSLVGFYILGKLVNWPSFYEQHFVSQSTCQAVALILFTKLTGLYTFWVAPLFSWFSRKNEFEADHFAATYAKAEGLISALLKLYKENASTLTPDPLYSFVYYSHPTALERIGRLEKL